MRTRAETRADAIVDVVVDLLETEGYEAVQVRSVARRARTSLATMYKLFGTRDELIVTALKRWMDANAYGELTMPEPHEPPYDTMMRVLRTVIEPWERHPRMLKAYHRALSGPGGERLDQHGLAIVHPIVQAALPDADPQYLSDIEIVHGHVVRGAIARFAADEIAVTDILPILERALFRLTTDNRPEANRSGLGDADAGGRPRPVE
jgi:TetR/AcrR family transcriptional regulator, cholesterol catabolism regulator